MSSIVNFDKLRFVRRLKILAYILLFGGVLLGLVFIVFAYFRPKAAGIYIETNPISTVFINGEEKGVTPYKENFPPQDIVVRLVSTQDPEVMEPLETKTTLVSGVETVIRHNFSLDKETASTEVISFEKIENNSSGLSIITAPEGVKLLIDGRDRAFAPYKTTSLAPGEHNILISENGYEDKVIKLKTHNGYNLTLFVDLARNRRVEEEPTPQESTVEENTTTSRVRILPTGTGFLRIRSEPNTNGLELGRVEPGEIYQLVNNEVENGWYFIEYSPGEYGWISAEYVELLDD